MGLSRARNRLAEADGSGFNLKAWLMPHACQRTGYTPLSRKLFPFGGSCQSLPSI